MFNFYDNYSMFLVIIVTDRKCNVTDNVVLATWGDNIKKKGWVRKMWILTNFNAMDCCQTTINEKLITDLCKLQKHLGSSKISSLKSALLGKVHVLLQDGVVVMLILCWSYSPNLMVICCCRCANSMGSAVGTSDHVGPGSDKWNCTHHRSDFIRSGRRMDRHLRSFRPRLEHCCLVDSINVDFPIYLALAVSSNFKWATERQNQQNGMFTQGRLRSAWASAQSDQSLHCPLNG